MFAQQQEPKLAYLQIEVLVNNLRSVIVCQVYVYNNALEQLVLSIKSQWPATVTMMHFCI
jgi:hypothetical protein